MVWCYSGLKSKQTMSDCPPGCRVNFTIFCRNLLIAFSHHGWFVYFNIESSLAPSSNFLHSHYIGLCGYFDSGLTQYAWLVVFVSLWPPCVAFKRKYKLTIFLRVNRREKTSSLGNLWWSARECAQDFSVLIERTDITVNQLTDLFS